MKKVLLLTLILCYTLTFAQKNTDTPNELKVIYKGFKVGMTKSEAKKEFNRDKLEYKNIELGNGFSYLVFPPFFTYDSNEKLTGIALYSKTRNGMRKSVITQCFDDSKEFFEKHGYQFLFNPAKSSSLYHIFMNNTDKNTVIEMFTVPVTGYLWYVNVIKIYNYDELIKTDYLNKMAKTGNFEKNGIQNDTGF